MSSVVRAKLSHLDARGRVKMVDVSGKPATRREAVARGRLFMHKDTLSMLRDGRAPKGDVIAAAHIAGVMAAKRASEIIPLAHAIPVEAIDIAFRFDDETTWVAIEARTAVAAAGLTLYDMLKAVDRGMVIGEIALWEKRGGRSGVYRRR